MNRINTKSVRSFIAVRSQATGESIIYTIISAFLLISLFILPEHSEATQAGWKVWEGKLNINEASEAEFTMLEGIGKVTSHRIVEYRKRMGGFKSMAQLKEVKGISQNKFKKLEQHLTLFEKSDLKVLVDINRAPVSALQALPGISKKTAISITEYRERNEGFKEVEEILLVPGIKRAKFEELKNFIAAVELEIMETKKH